MLEFTLGVVHPVGFNKCMMTCVQHDSIAHNSRMVLNWLGSAYSSLPDPTPGTHNHWSYYCAHSLGFPTMHRVEIIQHTAFLAWLLSLSRVHLKFLTELFLRDDRRVLNPDLTSSALLAIRKMEIPSSRYRTIPTGVQKTGSNKNRRRCGKIKTLMHC